jgi:hypothetical protein
MYSELGEDINGSLSFDVSVANVESENADPTQRRIKGGKKINKSSELRKSLIGDVETGIANHVSSSPSKKSLTESHDDPYYVFREDLLSKLELVEDSLKRYESIVKNTVSRVCKRVLCTFILYFTLLAKFESIFCIKNKGYICQ